MSAVLFDVDTSTNLARIYSPYDQQRVEIIRSLPSRHWDKEGRFWEFRATSVPWLKAKLEEFGDTVEIRTVRIPRRDPFADHPPRAQPTTTTAPQPDGRDETIRQLRAEIERLRREAAAHDGNWAEDLLRQCSPELADKVHRRLAGVLHPDVGGSHELMRDLNVARDVMDPA